MFKQELTRHPQLDRPGNRVLGLVLLYDAVVGVILLLLQGQSSGTRALLVRKARAGGPHVDGGLIFCGDVLTGAVPGGVLTTRTVGGNVLLVLPVGLTVSTFKLAQ